MSVATFNHESYLTMEEAVQLVCPECSQVFIDYYEFSRHLVQDHAYSILQLYSIYGNSNTKVDQICPICGKSYIIGKYSYRKYKWKSDLLLGCSSSCRTKLQAIFKPTGFQIKEVRQKAVDTWMQHYGTDNPWKSPEGMKHMHDLYKQKTGFANPFVVGSPARLKGDATRLTKYGSISPFGSETVRIKARETIRKLAKANKWGTADSHINKYWQQQLQQFGFATDTEFLVDKYRYDLAIFGTQVVIDINPSYTHNSTKPTYWSNNVLSREYHRDKAMAAYALGFLPVFVFDWHTVNQVVSVLNAILSGSYRLVQEVPMSIWFDMKKHTVLSTAEVKVVDNPNAVQIVTAGFQYQFNIGGTNELFNF